MSYYDNVAKPLTKKRLIKALKAFEKMGCKRKSQSYYIILPDEIIKKYNLKIPKELLK